MSPAILLSSQQFQEYLNDTLDMTVKDPTEQLYDIAMDWGIESSDISMAFIRDLDHTAGLNIEVTVFTPNNYFCDISEEVFALHFKHEQ